MRDSVKRAMERHGLLARGEAALVAVSGGMDSMVLLDVLHKLRHPCQVLHVDHGLRGIESNADREGVLAHCAGLGIKCHVRQVDVKAESLQAGTSMQMAARELRRTSLLEVADMNGIKAIALAHHADDAVETLLMHLMRGTGIKGWASIAHRSGRFIRPLLSIDRDTITAYAHEQAIPFREDSSNSDPKYLRNRVRHELIPLMEQLRSGTRRSLRRSVELLREMVPVVEQHLDQEAGDGLQLGEPLEAKAILASPHPLLLLTHLLQGRGLHPEQLGRVLQALEAQARAHFDLGDGELWVADGKLTLHPPAEGRQAPIVINEDQAEQFIGPLHFQRSNALAIDLDQGRLVAWLDAEKLHWPLEIRPWQAGDSMQPLGLDGTKLISDMLTDAKVKEPHRAKSLVLLSGGKIIWLVGLRLAEGCAAHASSRGVWRVESRVP